MKANSEIASINKTVAKCKETRFSKEGSNMNIDRPRTTSEVYFSVNIY